MPPALHSASAHHRQRDWVFFLSSWGENWAHVFGRGNTGTAPRLACAALGRRAGGRLMGTQAAVDRRRRSHARARFWAEEGGRETGTRYLFAVERNGCWGNFKKLKWRQMGWVHKSKCIGLTDFKVAALFRHVHDMFMCSATADRTLSFSPAPSPPLTSVTSSERCHCK